MRTRVPTIVIVTALAVFLPWLAPGRALGSEPAGSEAIRAPDFDIRGPVPNSLPAPPSRGVTLDQENVLTALSGSVSDLQVRWSALTSAPSRIYSLTDFLSLPSDAEPRDIAHGFISDRLALFRLSPQDIGDARFSREFSTAHNGVTHLTLQQQIDGIDVFGGALKINVDNQGRVINVSGEPLPSLEESVNVGAPVLTSLQAVESAAAGAGILTVRETISERLVYFPIAIGELRLAWEVVIDDADSPNMYQAIVDAVDGAVLWRHCLTDDHHVPAHGEVYDRDSPDPNSPTGTSTGILPRVDAGFNGLAVFPHADAHADWWNGSGEADRNRTWSNNVRAHEDRAGADSDGDGEVTTTGENFTFPLNLANEPSGYTDAATVNLFYWVNRFHDLFYALGFDEPSGNFQINNFGLGGLGGDPVQADSQDNADGVPPSNCNANMSTPADGSPPRMQMYVCNRATPKNDGDLDATVIAHEYTHGVHTRLVPTAGSQLGNEGWCDFFALSFFAEPGDDTTGIFPLGGWLFNRADGLRRYTIDQSFFTMTYADLASNANCHVRTCSNNNTQICTEDADCGAGNTCDATDCFAQVECAPPYTPIPQGPCVTGVYTSGQIWSETLWLAWVNLVDKYGFDVGRRTMNLLTIDGMKLLAPDYPTFLDLRDHMLLADQASNAGVNQCLIWDAFARMGMGVSAVTTDIYDINPIEGYDMPSTCTPDIQLTAPLDFGEVCVGDSQTLPLEVYNTANGDLIVRSVAVVSGSNDISVDPLPDTPVFIGPGSQVDFAVHCSPTSFGDKTAVVRITSNDPDEAEIDLDYTCSTPPGDIRVTGSTDFGDVCAGVLAEKTVSVCNVGHCNLEVAGASIDCAEFTLINSPFPATVSPDSCVDLVVRFTPTTAGMKTCTLTIESDDPDAGLVDLTLTGNTPLPIIDVPPDLTFPPTVLQDVDACDNQLSFPISNVGTCPLSITEIAVADNPDEYFLGGVPSYPIILAPGHVAGDGDLRVGFSPLVLDRGRIGAMSVTWVSEPITGDVSTETRLMCGEGVRTGARVLVTEGGVPLDVVKSIRLQRINANRNKDRLDTIDNSRSVPLQTVASSAPCASFQYHREYSTVSNPVQLLPGSYQVTVTARIAGKVTKKTVGFDVGSCDFNPTIVVDF